jgi:dTDP-4-amino-4,6-dideoxygalactose transaminase
MVPFLDLKIQYASIKSEVDEAVQRVLASGQFVLGEEVETFEEQFAAYCRVRHAVAVNSGTSALHLALLAAGVGPGDEVITVSHTFVATAAAIRYTGAKPVFVDIDPESYTMSAAQVEARITQRTKVVLPVHLYGQPADMDPILQVAAKHGLPVVEDAAQAHGAEYKGRRVGGIGDLGCFSFHPGKNLGAYGEGGSVVTNNPEFARTLRMLRNWGQERKQHHELRGFNYRMASLQGAILAVKLRHLEAWTAARRSHAARYNELLGKLDMGLPAVMPYARHVFHIYAVRVPQRDRLLEDLKGKGVHAAVHYRTPVHLQPSYADLGYAPGDFPHAEKVGNEVLSLPMFAELTEKQMQLVSEKLHEVARARS